VSKELFGTDGIRGVPGEYPLDDETLYLVGRALGAYLRDRDKSPRVLIGMDTRESGPHIAAEIATGLFDEGVAASSAGVITTPGVACLVRKDAFSAGLVVSASHNPYHDNGVKLFAGSGMKFPDQVEEQLESEIWRRRSSQFPTSEKQPVVDLSLDNEYLTFLRGCSLTGADLPGMKIVLDCANGAASSLAPELFRSLGADVIAIHNKPDGRNINADCGSLHPAVLQERVVSEGAALGVAFDGDADRAMLVSATGRLVDGDGILLAAARYLRDAGQLKGTKIIGTTMANLGLEIALATEGLSLVRVPVGDRYVLEEMLRSGANLGGEQSGHIIFLDDTSTGDGLLTALKLAGLVAIKGPLDQLIGDLKIFPQAITNINVRVKPPWESLPAVANAVNEATRALGTTGRVVVRYSGTEPKIRVMIEAEYPEVVAHWSERLATVIKTAIGT
jgi:phosphoglucosamine mutase